MPTSSWRIVREHSNVRGVLWGHVHQSLDSFVHGVRFMATPATCAQFLPGSADFAIDNRPPGYRVLELMPDGAIADGSLLARELRAKRRRVATRRNSMIHMMNLLRAAASSRALALLLVLGRRRTRPISSSTSCGR